MKTINIGIYPPPYGGVSIHLKRLKEYLQEMKIDHELIDVSKQNKREKINEGIKALSWKKAVIYLFFHKRAILHFHNFSWENAFVYYILGFKHIIILSFHNERFLMEIEKAPGIIQKLIIKSVNAVNYIIVVSQKCHTIAEKIIKNKSKIFVIPAFIPPARISYIDEQYPIMEMRKKHEFLFSSNAFQISFHNGIDLYGIDMLIQLTARLNEEHIGTACCFLLPAIGDENYLQQLKKKIQIYNLQEKFLFITEPLEEASSLWRISDVVIRATNTDGNSLTVLESLYVGTPVIASDCVPRPEGVVLFKTRDLNSLYKEVKMILLNLEEHKKRVKNMKVESNAYKITNLYKSVLEANT